MVFISDEVSQIEVSELSMVAMITSLLNISFDLSYMASSVAMCGDSTSTNL